MKSRAQGCAVAFLVVAFGVSGADAQSVSRKNSASRTIGDTASLEVYAGYMSGESRELVIDAGTGFVNSELFWKINKASVIGGAFTYSPRPWMTFKVSGWVPASAVNTMDDYDYLAAPSNAWTDLSHHDDTSLDHAWMIDARVGVRVLSLPPMALADRGGIEAIAGFRRFNIAWTAKGGSFIYSSGGGFRNDTGNFAPGQTVIKYEQWMYTPFLGIGGSVGFGRWSLDGSFIGSLWGEGRDRDDHVLRSTLFTDEFSKVKMIGIDTALNYAVNDRISVFGRYEYQKYYEARGASTANDYGAGTVTVSPGDAAGMSHYSMVVSFGIKGRL
ncbi:omptin family outer membrane protease [Undibacter mobilis]|uniref:Omptin family outer membrane protease n=1 Tax=Undibacter mobilis TaxID=2292256 RepID=A0A371B9D3_9BRAD|nr:omptin family outer membrane protease [Undibacter mobilis]RDV04206.1 omptin family outer membrane protease [Undibacter mobilis]